MIFSAWFYNHLNMFVFALLFSVILAISLSLFLREEVLQVQVEPRFHLKAERASQRSLNIPRMSLSLSSPSFSIAHWMSFTIVVSLHSVLKRSPLRPPVLALLPSPHFHTKQKHFEISQTRKICGSSLPALGFVFDNALNNIYAQ